MHEVDIKSRVAWPSTRARSQHVLPPARDLRRMDQMAAVVGGGTTFGAAITRGQLPARPGSCSSLVTANWLARRRNASHGDPIHQDTARYLDVIP